MYSDEIILQHSPAGKNEVIELDARSVERRLNMRHVGYLPFAP